VAEAGSGGIQKLSPVLKKVPQKKKGKKKAQIMQWGVERAAKKISRSISSTTLEEKESEW